MNVEMLSLRVPGPLGEMLLVATPDGSALCGLYLERQKFYPGTSVRLRDAPRLPLFARAASQLRDYFAGARTRFDLPLAPNGTAFQQDVWSAIRDVPFGQTISYAELARRCGRPSAVRAAGAATGRNPMTIIVPCHRIVGTGGALTGYAGGLDRKRALLELESRRVAPHTSERRPALSA
jgi:methylated-DNA-[protein]-cysteine S-methyltransferase